MYIPNDDIQNCPFCRLQLVVKNVCTLNLINSNSLKESKVVIELENGYKTWGLVY